MEKKCLLRAALSVWLAFFGMNYGLVYATYSSTNELEELSDDQDSDSFVDDSTRDKVLAACLLLSMKDKSSVRGNNSSDESSRRILEASVRTIFQTAGRPPDFSSDYKIPSEKTSSAKSCKSSGITIRPAKAHKRWKRLQKNSLLSWPLAAKEFRISSYFGPRVLRGQRGFHQGIDMAAPTGTLVKSAAAGIVIQARYLPGYGNCILLRHQGRYKTRYAHLQKMLVKVGQHVRSGELIGKVGATGKVAKGRGGASGSHLHFEVYSGAKRIDPFFVLA